MNKARLLSLIIVIIYAVTLAVSAFYLSDDYKEIVEPKDDIVLEGNITLEFYVSSGYCSSCEEVKPIISNVEQYYGDNISVERNPVDSTQYIDNFNKWRDYGFSSYPSAVVKNTSINISHELYEKSVFLFDLDEYSIKESFDYPIFYLDFENLTKYIDISLAGNYTNITINESLIPSIPIFGNLSEISLPVLTIIYGLVDSLNPCSFFVLLFLLSLLLYTKSRKRMLLIGGIFIFFSGFIYFLLMATILNAVLFVEQQVIIAIIAGVIALVFGSINIKDFFAYKKGISATIPEKEKSRLYKQMRKIIKISSIPSVIIATIILAISANTVELICSFQLPFIYTGTILPFFNLNGLDNYLYILFYNILYVIPLLIIVLAIVITLGRWKLSEFQGRILKLFSGLMILSLGEVLLINLTLLENILVTIGILLISLFLTFIISLIWKISSRDKIQTSEI
jgi:hypothetical protein